MEMNDYLKHRQEQKLYGKPIVPKKQYVIPKKSPKKIKEEAAQKEAGTDNGLDKWFEERRREMSGLCELCGGKTCRDDDDIYRRSIHHLFDKRPTMFPSVSCHPDNWLELCFWGNSCHQNIHNGTITWELLHDSAEWTIIVEKFKKIYPFMAEKERKNIPEILLRLVIVDKE